MEQPCTLQVGDTANWNNQSSLLIEKVEVVSTLFHDSKVWYVVKRYNKDLTVVGEEHLTKVEAGQILYEDHYRLMLDGDSADWGLVSYQIKMRWNALADLYQRKESKLG